MPNNMLYNEIHRNTQTYYNIMIRRPNARLLWRRVALACGPLVQQILVRCAAELAENLEADYKKHEAEDLRVPPEELAESHISEVPVLRVLGRISEGVRRLGPGADCTENIKAFVFMNSILQTFFIATIFLYTSVVFFFTFDTRPLVP